MNEASTANSGETAIQSLKEIISYFLKSTPLFTAFLVFSGVIKLIYYYSLFGFKIFYFLDLSETLTLFMDDLFAIFSFALYYLTYAKVNHIIYHINYKNENKKKFHWLSIILKVILYFLILMFLFALVLSIRQSELFLFIFTSFFVITRYFTLENIYNKYLPRLSEFSKGLINGFVFMIALLYLYIFISAYYKYYTLHKYREKRITAVYLKNNLIKPYSEEYYIGMTKNYIFIYNEINSTTTAIPITEVNKIETINVKGKDDGFGSIGWYYNLFFY